jgi:GNAT superfamily N-acetyltransferase
MLSDRFTVRRALVGEEQALALLGSATFLESYAGFLSAEDILTHCAAEHNATVYARYLAASQARVYAAAADPGGALVGYAVACPLEFALPGATPADYELRRIYVLHRYQGKGVGQALLDQIIAAARELGYKRLLLGVNVDNVAAIRFYGRQGFARIGERRFQVGRQSCHDDVLALAL